MGRVPKTVFVLVLAEVEVECLLHFQLCTQSFPCGASWSEGAEYTKDSGNEIQKVGLR